MKTIFTFLFSIIILHTFGQGSETFNTSGSFFVPKGIPTIKFEGWGRGANAQIGANRGGGGGAYSSKEFTNLTASTNYSFQIGTSAASPNTSFGTITINGTNTTTGAAANTYGGTVISFSGGNGGSVSGNTGGGAGAGSLGAGANSNGTINGVGTGGGGTGGSGGPGAGGSLSSGSNLGGNGRIIFSWTCPSGTISYSSSIISNLSSPRNVIYSSTLASGGTFSASPTGLTIDANTGTITPSSSTIGTYTVTYSIPADRGCPAFSTTTTIRIGPIFVNDNATGLNNGNSWTNAFTSLESALTLARASSDVDEIWVAAGTYKPSRLIVGYTDNRYKAFHIEDNLKLYGGFAGNETTLSQRAFNAGNSILSGDIADTPNSNSDDALHVVIDINTTGALVDGFVVRNGNANGGAMFIEKNFTNWFVIGSDGGGIYTTGSSTNYNNMVVTQNNASENGGGVSATGGSVSFTNTVIVANNSGNLAGGIMLSNSSTSLTNCTVVSNTSNSSYGAIYSTGGSPVVRNSIFYNNTFNYAYPLNVTVSYSIFERLQFVAPSVIPGTGNLNSNPYFRNINDPDGADNIWMTADDGLRLGSCSDAIDAGLNSNITTPKDIANQIRLFDVSYIPNTSTITVDMGAYENQSKISTSDFAGTIGNSHIVPFPQELIGDQVTNVTSPPDESFVRSWYQTNDTTSTWTLIANQKNLNYLLPNLNPSPQLAKDFYFRRAVTCRGQLYNSYAVSINVQIPNGAILGKVVSLNGVTGVQGIQVCAVKNAALPGSPATHQYCTTTAQDGTYSISPVFYGDRVSIGTATFVITPSYANHTFTPTILNRTLTSNLPQTENVNFTDNTVYNITGRIYQKMTNAGLNNSQTIEEDVDDVSIFNNNVFSGSVTGFLPNPPPGGYGRYAVAVQNPATYKIEPKLTGHQFDPAFTNVSVTADVSNIHFEDTTTHVISGFLRGCNNFIGTAELEFRAVLPNRPSNFYKTIVTTGGSGHFSIKLPARKYKVTVKSVNSNIAGTGGQTITDFINALPTDSLVRDISLADKTLNLIYIRPPKIEVVGFDDICTTAPAFSIMEQNINKSFSVKILQDNTTCFVKDSTLRLSTNIQQDDTNELFTYQNPNGTVQITLKGGKPNIISPYFKTFSLSYTDRYNRSATFSKNVVVTGLRSENATFTTVSPQIPLKVLHDPPGDESYSFWETSSANEQAVRFFGGLSSGSTLWGNIKIGTKLSTGVGVETENSFWGQIGTTLSVNSRRSTDDETILSSSQTATFSTSSSESVTGTAGDVYIGAAINLVYAKANIIKHTGGCNVSKVEDFIIAPDGFDTHYIYSESHILNTIIPNLKNLRDNPSNTTAERNKYSNQIKVWEQVISNNITNKNRAPFIKNISFDGAVGTYSDVISTSSTNTSTIEFGMEIDTQLAADLGFEIAGSGASGGSVMNVKMETGNSIANTSMNSTTTGYYLDDTDNGDSFSIDIKRDPVYNTPVFELVAGTSSCPYEEGTLARDAMQLVIPTPTINNIDPNGEGEFTLKLGNLSNETRTYLLSFDQATNPNGAVVKVGGTAIGGTPISYTISSGGEINVLVKVGMGASNVFAYTGLTFTLSDECSGGISKTGAINAYFQSPCSNVSLAAPIENWSNNTNSISILIKDYNVANLNSVSLEYAAEGSNSWATGFTKLANELFNDPSGTLVNWNVTSIPDGKYALRLKLICQTNTTIYSSTVKGTLDRKAPIVFGIPTPSDDNFINGDVISIAYNEFLGCENLNNSNLLLKNVKTNTVINAQLGCFQNKLIVAPLATMGVLGDSVRVTITGVRDLHNNIKSTADSWRFVLGNFTPATGDSALTLATSGGNAPIISSGNGDISMNEDAAGTLDFYFNLPVNATKDKMINFTVSGSANAADDYSVSYFPANQPNSTKFNGTSGTITIKAGSKYAILKIDPKADTKFEGNETIIITVNEGGNYGLTNNIILTGTILNDDADDCLNGGNTFQLSNNNQTNTAIEAGTYHKGRIETVGNVVAPTSVTIKAQNSVLLKPGFEIKAGSIFRANIENCPQFNAPYSIPKENNARLIASNTNSLESISEEISQQVQYEKDVFVVVDKNKIDFEFKLEKSNNISLVLIDENGAEKLKMIENQDFKTGTYTATIDTESLRKGKYFIKLETGEKMIYQQVTIL